LHVVPDAQQAVEPPTSQQVSVAEEQQTVPPPHSLPLSQQSPNSILQTALTLVQHPDAGQLTPQLSVPPQPSSRLPHCPG
jgi:hypothetical protein